MKRRPRRRYRAIRRVPQAYPGLYLRLKVAPIVPALAATVAVGALAEISALPPDVRARARSLSDDMGTAISEKSQRIFFAVSYTHLDVYKRQIMVCGISTRVTVR